MKIVVDGRGIKNTGIGRYIENTLGQLLKIDTQNQYVLLIKPQDRDVVSLEAPNLVLKEIDAEWFSVAEQTKLLKVINALKPDLVHFTNFNFPVRYKGKFVITVHDLTMLRFKNLRSSLGKKLMYHIKDPVMRKVVYRQGLRKAKVILTPTEFVKEDVATTFGIRRNKIVVTTEAVDKDFATSRVNLQKFGINKPYLLYVGNAYPHKNLERLIIGFGKLVVDYLLDYQLVIAGKKDSFHKSLEQAVADAKLGDRVIFTGFVSDQELAGLYKNATLYVFPSLSEGFGLPPLEAMAHGLPVVSSNATCLPEVLGDAAVYFNPKNIASMAKVMSGVLSDTELQDKLRQKGLKQIKKYNWQQTAKQTLEVYNTALQIRKK